MSNLYYTMRLAEERVPAKTEEILSAEEISKIERIAALDRVYNGMRERM